MIDILSDTMVEVKYLHGVDYMMTTCEDHVGGCRVKQPSIVHPRGRIPRLVYSC